MSDERGSKQEKVKGGEVGEVNMVWPYKGHSMVRLEGLGKHRPFKQEMD